MQTGTWRTSWRAAAATALLALVGTASEAQAGNVPAPAPATGRLIPAADLRADAATPAPRPTRRCTRGCIDTGPRPQIDTAFAALDGEFAGIETLGDAYLAIARLTTSSSAVTPIPNFFNQDEEVERALLERPRIAVRVPLAGSAHGRHPRRISTCRNSGAGNRDAVDRWPSCRRTILDGLLPYSRADGGNDAKRVATLKCRATVGTKRSTSSFRSYSHVTTVVPSY